MEFGRAFTYITQDPDWLKKVGIAAGLMLIPVLGWIIVGGWGLEITRRVIQDDPTPLPDWSDFGNFAMLGLKGFVVGLVFSLPGGLVNTCQSTITALTSNPDVLRELGSDAATVLASAGGIVALCCGCLGLILSLAATFISPAALGNMMANDGQLGAAFRFGEVFGMVRSAIGPYLMVLLGTLVVAFIVPFGLIICFIGIAATAAWGSTVLYHLYGQAYKAAKGNTVAL
ncbi:MAG: DUF4013 domain-containing protein [Anaerolineales bacterium]